MELVRRHDKSDTLDKSVGEHFEIHLKGSSDINVLHDILIGEILISGNEFNNTKCNDNNNKVSIEISNITTSDNIQKVLHKEVDVSTQLESNQCFTDIDEELLLHSRSENKNLATVKPASEESVDKLHPFPSRKRRNMNPFSKTIETDSHIPQGQLKSNKIPVDAQTKIENPRSQIKTRVAKKFGGTLYFGTITHYRREGLWHVLYDDGDEEDYDSNDLSKAKKLFSKNRDKDKRN